MKKGDIGSHPKHYSFHRITMITLRFTGIFTSGMLFILASDDVDISNYI
jgi:hypothetical protein